jgi:ribosomal protein S18 acetylase RimI-like enzyme
VYERTVRQLTRRGLAGSLRELVARCGSGVAAEDDGMLLYAAGPPHPGLFNGALRVENGLVGPEALRVAGRFFARLGRAYTLWTLDEDGDLESAARTAGLLLAAELPDMVLDRPPPPGPTPAGVTVRRVADGHDVRAAHDVLGQAFATLGVPRGVWSAVWPGVDSLAAPHITTVVADLDGRPAATAMAVVTGDVGQVLNVGTVPWARGRRLGEAVTRATIEAAFAAGAAAVALQATVMGEPLYRRLGFAEVGRSRCYVSARAPAT